MLVELFIKNIAVIEEVRLECVKGFHVLTGETGAGKSIVIDALSLVAGGRGSTELIRHGCEKAEVEALFELPKNHPVIPTLELYGIEFAGEEHLIIRRELTMQGKSVSRINGNTVTLTTLREISEHLINIHGQHEHQSLFKTDRHVDWLDQFGGQRILPIKVEYTEYFQRFSALQNQLKTLAESARQSAQVADLYRYQLEEIRAAKLKPGEDELLLVERNRLANAEKLSVAAHQAYEALNGSGGALGTLHQALQKMQEITKYDAGSMSGANEQLETAYFQAEDIATQLRDYRDSLEFNPNRLQQIETRLDIIQVLRKKYGATVADILAHEQQVSTQLDMLDRHDDLLAELTKQTDELHGHLKTAAERLHEARLAVADTLAKQVIVCLQQLQMERARFHVKIERKQEFGKTGADQVEFLISANPGEPLRPLAKVASGGECSRIMLALKTIFAELENIAVLVFDEVDTGVSGRAAQAIAEKMCQVAQVSQVFAITHLPQVACMADRQFLIDKQIVNERTVTHLIHLQDDARIEELARMLGGAMVTDTTRQHAKEMLALAASIK